MSLLRSLRKFAARVLQRFRTYGAGLLKSQFLKELPPELIEHGDEKGKQPVTTESGKGMFTAMREMLD